VAIGEAMEAGEIVPDRFDAGGDASTPSTVRLRRDEVVPRREEGSAQPAARGGRAGTQEDSFGGSFEAEFDLVDEAPSDTPIAPVEAQAETGGWAPPPEAPPAETWQDTEAPAEAMPPEAPIPSDPSPVAMPHSSTAPAEPRKDGRGAPLTAEMIDLIAEKVVERLADRVVREVAWEVVPGVAEALVRKRIKELEESGS
jgi:hypothetical protein